MPKSYNIINIRFLACHPLCDVNISHTKPQTWKASVISHSHNQLMVKYPLSENVKVVQPLLKVVLTDKLEMAQLLLQYGAKM